MSMRMKAHGTQLRASGDPYFSHPVEVAGILAEMKLDTASIVTGLLHDTVEDTVATLDEIDAAVRRRDRPAGRRRHQAVAARAAVRADQAGREFPQAGARDVERHPRAAGQARRPPAQHAHARITSRSRRQAPAHRARDDGHLCAARRAHRHAADEGRARGPGLRRAQSRRPRHRCWPASATCASKGERHRAADRGRAGQDAEGRRARRRRSRAARRRPIRSGARCSARTSSFEQLSDIMAFRVIVDDVGALLPGARHACTAAITCVPGSASRTTSRRPSRTTTARCTPA